MASAGSPTGIPMTSEIALKVGMAAGKMFSNGSHRHRVVIGKDTRLSGYMIESALLSGFTAVGMDVFLLGPMPTPAVAMLTRSLRADLGVMISASHNPYDDNGIKFFDPDGYKLSDEAERRDRGADRRPVPTTCWPRPTASAAPRGSRARRSATSSSPSARCRATSASTACGSSSIAPTAPATRWRPRRCGSSAPR